MQLLLAVEYCHEHQIVHRDLKMENVMVTRTGDLKLIGAMDAGADSAR